MTLYLGTFAQPSFMALVGFGAVVSVLFVALRHRTFHQIPSFLKVLDVGLVTMTASVVGAKLGYIVLHDGDWSAGGLSWHAGLLFGMVVLYGMSRWRKLDQGLLWDSVAWCLPLIMLMAWWGCRGAACGFGHEVDTLADYPVVMVWEGRDLTQTLAPRFATQSLGMIGAIVAWLILGVIAYRGWLIGRWFGVVIGIISLIMFGLGFLRADPSMIIGGIRADQWLDLGGIVLGAVMCLTRPSERRSIPQVEV
jgi:hypothetical protein